MFAYHIRLGLKSLKRNPVLTALMVGAIAIGIAVCLTALNVFTLVSDTFPRHAVGSVVGLGGFAGAVGGMLIAKLTGYILQATGSYVPVFLIAAFAYLTALAIVHLLVPRLEPAHVG